MKNRFVRIAVVVSSCTLLLIAALFLFFRFFSRGSSSESQPDTYTAHFILPDREFELQTNEGGNLTLPAADEIDSYVFLGWRNEYGLIEKSESVVLTEDSFFAAIYTVDLVRDTHPAYLFADEEGRCRPNYPMTRADAAAMFGVLLAVPVEGSESFSDIPEDAEIAAAAAVLKTLGVVDGDEFLPDQELTLGELLCMLAHFYPAPERRATFDDVPDGTELYAACCLAVEQGWLPYENGMSIRPQRIMTRLDTAVLMNRVLGRGNETLGEHERVAEAFRDLPKDEASRVAMLEAVVTHSFEETGRSRRWSSSVFPATQIPGFTSGSRELDKLLAQILADQIDSEMDAEAQQHALYRYVRDHYKYHKGELYETGDTSWLVSEAKKLASTGQGNCYSYAALLCELYRAIGLDAEVYSGTIDDAPHAWVEADIDGVRYIFDVEMEYSYIHQNRQCDMYRKTYEEMIRWDYKR